MKFNQLDNIVKAHDITGEVYERPRLRVFGPVGVLTQSGSGTTSELQEAGMSGMLVCMGSPNLQNAMC